ncbi:unnamed protein product [Polarella glacialis]|uniref:Uncharacterized protein n=1 Tax=Polarella glacialis TaxID=89957 RepID=A0A813JAS0_POLGL|nr:unnamed protein product [Polarella glacialis]
MAAVKLIKFVAVAILLSSSDAEPTNRTCAGQDQDEMMALQVGVQSHAGTCSCGDVCPGYNGQGGGEVEFSCSDAQEAYFASNPGVDQEALSQTDCSYTSGKNQEGKVVNTKCWSGLGSALTVTFKLPYYTKKTPQYPCLSTCPAGFLLEYFPNPYDCVAIEAAMEVGLDLSDIHPAQALLHKLEVENQPLAFTDVPRAEMEAMQACTSKEDVVAMLKKCMRLSSKDGMRDEVLSEYHFHNFMCFLQVCTLLPAFQLFKTRCSFKMALGCLPFEHFKTRCSVQVGALLPVIQHCRTSLQVGALLPALRALQDEVLSLSRRLASSLPALQDEVLSSSTHFAAGLPAPSDEDLLPALRGQPFEDKGAVREMALFFLSFEHFKTSPSSASGLGAVFEWAPCFRPLALQDEVLSSSMHFSAGLPALQDEVLFQDGARLPAIRALRDKVLCPSGRFAAGHPAFQDDVSL